MASGLAWTIVKPPRLTSGRLSGRIVAGPDLPVGLRSYVSRADLATFILDEITRARFIRQRVVVRVGIPHLAPLTVHADTPAYTPAPT
jgi:putative NADH-flavin reductase